MCKVLSTQHMNAWRLQRLPEAIEQWIGKNWVCLVKHRDETFGSGGPAAKIVETGRGFGEVLFCDNSVSYTSP